MKQDFSCIVCSEHTQSLVRHGVRDSEDFDVVKCAACGHIQLWPLPSVDEDKAYYDKDGQMKALLPVIDEKIIERNLPWVRQQVERYAPLLASRLRILEVGAGYGQFLHELRTQNGQDCYGIELSAERRAFAQAHFGIETLALNLMVDAIPNAHKRRYDGIVSFHVLEHISAPLKFLRAIREMAAPGGRVIIEVPNVDERFLSENAA